MNNYDRRWIAAKAFFTDRLFPALMGVGVRCVWGDNITVTTHNIRFNEDYREIYIVTGPALTTKYLLYCGNPDRDEGAHGTIEDTLIEFEDSFKLFKRVFY